MNLSPIKNLVAKMYKDQQGKPIILSESQEQIFASVAQKKWNRVHCMCHTRFGKSQTVGIAALTRVTTYPEKWAIMAGTKEKAKIIMDYVIAHIFDNEYTRDRFIPDKGESYEEIRRHRNKNHLTFATERSENGETLLSEIFIGTAKEALGFGAPNIILDEAALIDDDEYYNVVRMLGDDPFKNFMIKIGNPFRRNHFLESFRDPKYKKIIVDCYKGLKEGRISQATIDENRPGIHFPVLYECKYPSATEIDEEGYQNLITETDILVATSRNNKPTGVRKIGLDVARGGRNYNVFTLRTETTAEVLRRDLEPDTIKTGDNLIKLAQDNGVSDDNIYIDDSGVGGGVTDYVRSKNLKNVNAVNFGEAAPKVKNEQTSEEVPSEFLNVRAWCYASDDGLQAWVKNYGQLIKHEGWNELTAIRYKKNTAGKTQIEPKEHMMKRGIPSPDVADSLALTFAKVKKSVYHGINPSAVLGGGMTPTSAFGGVPNFPGMPG